MNRPLSGYYAALLSPFSDDGQKIREDELGRLVRHVASQGLDGIYVGGSTGEAFLLSESERMRILAVSLEAAEGLTAIAHVGDINPDVSLRLAREAARLGYHAISAIPPFYYPYKFPEIRAHYARLATATDLPFVIYNFPALSGVRLSPEQLSDLMSLPNVVGVKNTCPDHYALERLRRAAPEKTILNGHDETLLAGLALGCDGGIGSTYNIQGELIVRIGRALDEGRVDDARHLQNQANELIDILVRYGVLPTLKRFLSNIGFSVGPCRAPFAPLSDDACAAIDAAAATLDCLRPMSGGRARA